MNIIMLSVGFVVSFFLLVMLIRYETELDKRNNGPDGRPCGKPFDDD